ncbi:MAG: cell division protein FtsL [Pseudomonadota bacterium]
MTRFNFLLLAVLIFCSMSVVTSRHQERKAFTELQSEKDREAKLDQEWRELQIESQTLGTHKRIEQKASRDLGMSLPDPKKTVIVFLNQPQSQSGMPSPGQVAPVGATR